MILSVHLGAENRAIIMLHTLVTCRSKFTPHLALIMRRYVMRRFHQIFFLQYMRLTHIMREMSYKTIS